MFSPDVETEGAMAGLDDDHLDSEQSRQLGFAVFFKPAL
jgi:hypothetical protein